MLYLQKKVGWSRKILLITSQQLDQLHPNTEQVMKWMKDTSFGKHESKKSVLKQLRTVLVGSSNGQLLQPPPVARWWLPTVCGEHCQVPVTKHTWSPTIHCLLEIIDGLFTGVGWVPPGSNCNPEQVNFWNSIMAHWLGRLATDLVFISLNPSSEIVPLSLLWQSTVDQCLLLTSPRRVSYMDYIVSAW